MIHTKKHKYTFEEYLDFERQTSEKHEFINGNIEYYDNRKDVILNPLLIVAVLSPGTEKYDRGTKFDEYKTIPSFKEYVLISQKMPYVSTYFKEDTELWRIKTTMNKEATVYLRSIDLEISLKDIYDGLQFED